MKNIPKITLFVTAGLLLFGPFLRAETRNFDISDFKKISSGYGINVKVTQAREFGVEVTTEPEIWNDLEVRKRGDTLRLSLERNNWSRNRVEVEVSITMPLLREVSLSGGSSVTLSGVNIGGQSFEAELSGGATLEGELSCGDLELEGSGGSKFRLLGHAEKLELEGSGSSGFQLKELTVGDVEVDFSGASVAEVFMDGRLDAKLRGGSRLTYFGNAALEEVSATGGSVVQAGN